MERETILEASVTGNWLRLAALDVATGLEVVAMGPLNARAELERLATRKLAQALEVAASRTAQASVVMSGPRELRRAVAVA